MSQRNRLLKYLIVVMAAAMLVDAAFSTSSSNVKASTMLRPVAVVTLEK